MVARAGVYVRADIDDSSNEDLDQQTTAVGAEDRSAELTFVDLHTRLGSPPAAGAVERLTAAVQDRLHTISSADRVLFRWPWLLAPTETLDTRRIDRWLDRLTGGGQGEPVISSGISVGVIQHRIAGEPVLRWAGQAPDGRRRLLALARAIELHAMLKRGGAIWEPETYHYRLPSGEHTDKFIRFADAIQSPQDAYVIATWLSERLSDGVGVVVDTGGLTPVLIQLESFLARSGLTLGPTAILEFYPAGRPAVRRTVESAVGDTGSGIVGIQSVNSTGNLQRTLLDELERVAGAHGRSCTLDILVDRRVTSETCDRSEPDGNRRNISWLGLGDPSGDEGAGACSYCRDPDRAQFVAVDPRTYGEMVLPEPHLAMPDTSYADRGHRFWERVANRRGLAIEANPHPRSRVARGKRTALPVRLIPELVADPDGLADVIRAQCRQFPLPEGIGRTALVVAAAADFETVPRPAFVGGGDVNLEDGFRAALAGLGLDESLPLVAHDDEQRLRERIRVLNPCEAILVFTWGSVTGLTVRRIKLAVANELHEQSLDRAVNGLVLHARPSTPSEWSALANQFRPGVLADLWNSCFPWESPLADESRLLDHATLELSLRGRAFFDHRIEFLGLHAMYAGAEDDWSPRFAVSHGPHPEHVFWGMSCHGVHQQRVRGRSLYGKDLDCLSAYGAIGAVIHHTRLSARPKAAPRWVMFDLGRIVRSYFDAVITCSILRWLRPGELWWGADGDSPDSIRASVAYLLDQATDDVSEQVLLVPELLLAAAQGKVPRFAHDVVRERVGAISAKWPGDERYNTARGAVEVGLALLDLG